MCIQKHGREGQLGCKHFTECACGAPAPQCHGQAPLQGRACVKCLQFFVSDSIPECAQGAVAGSRGTEIGQTWEIQPACLGLSSIFHVFISPGSSPHSQLGAYQYMWEEKKLQLPFPVSQCDPASECPAMGCLLDPYGW